MRGRTGKGHSSLEWYLSQAPDESADEVLKSKLDGPFRIVETGSRPMITNPEELAEDLANFSN